MKISLLMLSQVIFISIPWSDGAHILFLSPIGTKSHKIFYMGIVNVLADKGHKVTIVSAYKNSKAIKNVVDVAPPELDCMDILANVFEEGGGDNVIKDLILDSARICNEGLALKEVQDLKKEKFDLVIMSMFFDYCYFALVHHFKVPFIFISPAGLEAPFASMSGSFRFDSIIPNLLMSASFPLTYTQRLKTVALNGFFGLIFPFYIYPKSEGMCREKGLCPPDMPSFHEFNKNSSFVIINSIKALENPPRPVLPNIIYAGGAHIKSGKPLSDENLKKWLDGSGEHGFIFFSLGSGVKPSNMPEKYRKILVNVFGSLPQRVLWKWDVESMDDLPSNVKLSKWLPQQDILAHPKIRLFITHGGFLSTMESTYNGVPCLGMPLFGDQFNNMNEAASQGWARVLLWKDLTEDSLKTVIKEILTNKSLKEETIKRASLMKDVPIHPAEDAAFWVEFTLRHGGAKHLQSPLFRISWYEFHNLDVWATILLATLLTVYIEYLFIKSVLRLCFGKKKVNSKNKKNKKD